jgi:VCBS repeat-containing protein
LLAAGFLGAWLTRFFRQDDAPDRPESLQDQLLIAVSSASPVALPDSPDHLVEQKSRFTIALERPIESSSPAADIPPLAQLPQPADSNNDRAVTADADNDDDDEAGILWLHRGDASPTAPTVGDDVVSETPLPGAEQRVGESSVDPRTDNRTATDSGIDSDASPSTQYHEEGTEDRIVSITELNEQMGPPAPEEEDDDEAGWLWWSDGVLAWFASATAGLLGGTGGGSGATIVDPVADSVISGLNIGFAAGPFINGRLDLKAIDGDGNTLFVFSGQAVGESLGDGATLTGVTTETVLGESVITGVNVAFDDYSGAVSLQVDAGSAYLDEARSVGAQTANNASLELDTPLRAFADVPSGEFGSVSMSPFTELAIRLIENAKDNLNLNLGTPNADDLTQAKSFYESATARVQDLVGVDIRNTNPVTVNQVSFADNAQTSASQYGLKLAALSQLGNDLESGVSAAIDRLFDTVDAQANDVRGEIFFSKPTQALRNQEQLTDSQDAYVQGNPTVADLVIDAVRPLSAPVIDPVVVVEAGSVTINGTAVFFGDASNVGETPNHELRITLGDNTVFTVDGVEGAGAGALTVVDPGRIAEDGTVESGDWSLRIDNLDQGVYTFDVFVVDEGANVTRSETASGDTTPQLILLDGTSGDSGATEVTLNLTEGDAADAISASTALLAVDLGSGDIVSASSFSVSATSNPLNLTDAELKNLVTLEDGTGLDDDGQGQSVALPGGTLLDGPSNLASLQWSFAGDADVFDALASGDTLTATYTLTGDDQDSNRSNEARLEVTITGTNDAPDVVVADAAGNEDTPIELTGLSIADVDENADLTVVLSVADGDVSIASDVSGGLGAGDISGGGSSTVTLTGTVMKLTQPSAPLGRLPIKATPILAVSTLLR